MSGEHTAAIRAVGATHDPERSAMIRAFSLGWLFGTNAVALFLLAVEGLPALVRWIVLCSTSLRTEACQDISLSATLGLVMAIVLVVSTATFIAVLTCVFCARKLLLPREARVSPVSEA